MKKNLSTAVSKMFALLMGAAVMAAFVMGVSTEALAKKKAGDAGAIVDLNTADQKALEELPGIGKATAAAIIKGRPYKSVDDLKGIKGMSDKKISAIRDKVAVGGAAPAKAAPAAAAPAAAEKAPKIPAASPAAAKPTPEKSTKSASKLAPGQRVNINTASKEELDALPGSGPVKAQAIIDSRPYQNPEDIMKVKGIKQKEFEKIKDSITVR